MRYTGDMSDRTKYFKERNQLTPVMPIRLPSRRHHDEIRAMALEDGVTVSELVRTLIGREMKARQTAASH